MSGMGRRSLRLLILLLLLLGPAACGKGTGPGASRTVWITASAESTLEPKHGYLDLTVVRDGAAPVFADSVQSPYTLQFTAHSGDLIYTDVKWAVPRSGTLVLEVRVGGEIILNRSSLYSREALVVSFWVP